MILLFLKSHNSFRNKRKIINSLNKKSSNKAANSYHWLKSSNDTTRTHFTAWHSQSWLCSEALNIIGSILTLKAYILIPTPRHNDQEGYVLGSQFYLQIITESIFLSNPYVFNLLQEQSHSSCWRNKQNRSLVKSKSNECSPHGNM